MRNKLTAVQIKNAKSGKLQDGGGLFLIKTSDTGKWIYRYQLHGRRREMGLGPYPTVTLSTARKTRDQWAAVLASGLDPIDERKLRDAAAAAERAKSDPTFSELAHTVFEATKAKLKGEGTAGRWMSPISTHIFPAIGNRLVSELTADHIRLALAPLWRTKHTTARKALNRTRIILRGGKRMGLSCDPDITDVAEYMLGEHVHTVTPITATPWQEIPALYESLAGRGVAAACLQFMILTVVRSAGCRGARFDEIENGVWTVPAERMKGRIGHMQDFAVPLSRPAQAIADQMAEISDTLLFPGKATSTGISDTALAKHLNAIGEAGRPHGFRTSFRTWVQDTDAATFDVAETALAHRVARGVERSYARSDLLGARRVLAEKWGRFVTQSAAAVIDLNGRAVR